MNLYSIVFSYFGDDDKPDYTIALIRAEDYSKAEHQAKIYAEKDGKKILGIEFVDETKINNKLLILHGD